MNKYGQYRKENIRDMASRDIHSIEREGIAARMHKPGYRRKMRHTQSKHAKPASR